jgi:hypothetical protein
LAEPLGWRPVLVLTRDSAIDQLHWVTVAPLTRTIRGLDSEVLLEPEADEVSSMGGNLSMLRPRGGSPGENGTGQKCPIPGPGASQHPSEKDKKIGGRHFPKAALF